MVAGIVLAAGLSRRMGTTKQLLPYAGTTLLGRALDLAEQSLLGQVVLVTTRQLLADLDLRERPDVAVVVNPRPEDGQSGSLRLGLSRAEPKAAGALIMMSDQPGVTAALIDHMVREFDREHASALVPTYSGRRSTPVLLGRELWPAASELKGDTGARALWAAHPELVRIVEVGHLGSGADLDTPEQYAAAVRNDRAAGPR